MLPWAHMENILENTKEGILMVRGKGTGFIKTEGQAEQLKGKVQAGFGDAKQNVKDKAQKAIDKI